LPKATAVASNAPSTSTEEAVVPQSPNAASNPPSKSTGGADLPAATKVASEATDLKGTNVVSASASPTPIDIEVNGEHLGGQTSTGIEGGLLAGVLLAIFILIGLSVLLFVYARRRRANSGSGSQNGHELAFEVETTSVGEFTFEDTDFSGAGSQYGNQSDVDPMMEDGIADFGETGQGEETLFGF
jgi:hypothetical protein